MTPAARSSPAMNSRLCFKARDPGGLGPKLTKRFRLLKDLFPSNSLSSGRMGTLGLASTKATEAKMRPLTLRRHTRRGMPRTGAEQLAGTPGPW
jgi:hypothetical protein